MLNIVELSDFLELLLLHTVGSVPSSFYCTGPLL